MSQYKRYNDLDIGDDFELPPGDDRRGLKLFKKYCAQCHTIRKDGAGMMGHGGVVGPNLYGVIGRTSGCNNRTSVLKYSETVANMSVLWTDKNMVAFLKNPRAFAGGAINMNFRGLNSLQDRVDITTYLKVAGHEDWMVMDGTPHQQNGWWRRGGQKSKSLRDSEFLTDKQMKPHQHLWRAIKQKASDSVGGFGFGSSEDVATAIVKDTQDLRTDAALWLEVNRAPTGVKPAMKTSSMNWPLADTIQQGPVRLDKPRQSQTPVNQRALKRKAEGLVQKSAAAAAAAATAAVTVPVASCEEPAAPSVAMSNGCRAPSGLWVFSDTNVPPGSQAVGKATAAAPAAVPVRPDGGVLTAAGLISYADKR